MSDTIISIIVLAALCTVSVGGSVGGIVVAVWAVRQKKRMDEEERVRRGDN